MTATCTNNNVEGWHNRLNTKAHHAQLPFYVLVPKLLKELEAKLLPIQRKHTRQLQCQLFKYVAAEITASQLLRKCSNIYSPPTISVLDKDLSA
jgi:hypothetical protein